MLLVLVAWNVREQALNPMEETAAQTLSADEASELQKKIDMQAEEADWFSEQFVSARQEAETELDERQARLALAEKETQKVKDELLRLDQLARQLDSEASATPEEVEHLKRLLAQQEQRKAEAELELAELQKEAAKNEKSYAIVPYRGPNGTFRRPIYIECCNDKIILQPEGIELVPADFLTLDRPDNPFNTALRVIRQYYVETNQIVRGSEPYPLLIVRPSGVEMYESVQQAIFENTKQTTGNWVKDFGYEIVNEDWKIQYPQPNDELRNRIAQQLEISRSRLSGYMMAMRMAEHQSGYGGGYGGNSPQYRVDHRGNVTPAGGQMQSAEELQRKLAANRQAGTQQAAPQQSTGQGTGGQWDGKHESLQDVYSTPGTPLNASQQKTMASGASGNGGNEKKPSTGADQKSGEEMTEQQAAMMQKMQSMPQRQQNWGLKGVTQFSSGVSRTVKIRCEANRFVLPAQAGLRAERVIPITASVFTAADQLVRAIWEFQESWDSAGKDLHWRPILQVQVSPGGEQRLAELKTHLRTSGLVIEE